MNNILLLSAGRRVELAYAFKAELVARKLPFELLATDMQPDLSAACRVVDAALAAPRVTDPHYIDFLLSTCRSRGIGLVIPTIDTELLLLAQQRVAFAEEGVQLIVSDEDLVRMCRDKRQTAGLFRGLGLDTPEIYDRNAIRYPCFAKPYDGSCSVGASMFPDRERMSDAVSLDPKMMFMEWIDGSHTEFTIDAYYDRDGLLACLVPRQRIEVRGGEISKGTTRRHFVYRYLIEKLRALKGARGCITLQLFANEKSGRFAALEINPRFGGGFPLSYSAGANYPGWLIDEYLLGKQPAFFDAWEADLMMLRYDAKVLVHDVA